MLDRITGFWPDGGGSRARLAARRRRTSTRREWFFKAHFFQDPVQPGSLGVEALVQLLQCVHAATRGDGRRARPAPRFEPIALGTPSTWKYRGQVVPTNRLHHDRDRDHRGRPATSAGASPSPTARCGSTASGSTGAEPRHAHRRRSRRRAGGQHATPAKRCSTPRSSPWLR